MPAPSTATQWPRRSRPRWPRRWDPSTHAGLVGVALGAWIAGCGCPDASVVLPIDQQKYDTLQQRYGTEALPSNECDAVCLELSPPTVCTPAGGSGIGASGGAVATGGVSPAGGGAGAGVGGATGGVAAAGGYASQRNCEGYRKFSYVSECQLAVIEWTRPAIVCRGTLPCD